jgi:hypothetical protein
MSFRKFISDFQPITLSEMDSVRLLNRIDTKYILSLELLPYVLAEVQMHYKALDIRDERVFSYNSLYYDTPTNYMYLAHHNGRLYRYKIRFREYVSSKLCFLEIKYKSKGNRTVKHRTTIDAIETELSHDSKKYIARYTPFKDGNLLPMISTEFSRITLVNNQLNERATIDLNLLFRKNGTIKETGNIVIIELKRDGAAKPSNLMKALGHYGIYPKGFSKYCIGRALIESDLKSNNFKERILTINKINNGNYFYRNFSRG